MSDSRCQTRARLALPVPPSKPRRCGVGASQPFNRVVHRGSRYQKIRDALVSSVLDVCMGP